MKRLIYLCIGLLVVAGLGYLTYNLTTKSGKSDTKVAALDFEIKDTASVDRIIITEPNGAEIELVRDGKKWTDKDGGCVQQVPVLNILEAAVNIRFKGYIPDNSMKTIINRMATIGTSVKFHQNGEWTKTWYIGSATPDHYGTYMLVESAENGRSDLPVIMEIKGLKGIVGPRFFADIRRWACTEIFSLGIHEIASVNVKHNGKPERNFKVDKYGGRFSVTTNGKPFPAIDTNMVLRYLQNYKLVHFENINSELSPKQVDSIKHAVPFCELTLKTTKGKVSKLRMFRRNSDNGEDSEVTNEYGEEVNWDANRFWCELPNGEVVKCQYFVFSPLIMGNIYFNYGQQQAIVQP